MKDLKILCILIAAGVLCTGCMETGDLQNRDTKEAASVTETTVQMKLPEETAIIRNTVTTAESEESEQTEEPAYDPETEFYMKEIEDELFLTMQGKSYTSDCITKREDLRYLHVLHVDQLGEIHTGEIICNQLIAQDLLDIFKELYKAEYPIEKIHLVDAYDASDDASMTDNNTSCFNFRNVPGSTHLSKHAYGRAIDINPLYNPYIHTVNGEKIIQPESGSKYADRSEDFIYKINKDDLCYRLFKEHGFTWGGEWNSEKDYQHFQK